MSQINAIQNKQVRDFATACYDGNSINDLRIAVNSDADAIDCRSWGITEIEWKQAINAALNDRLADEK